jgi:hypothetical protein
MKADADSRKPLPQKTRAVELQSVAVAAKLASNRLKVPPSDDQIDILREAAISVKEHRHGSGDCEGNIDLADVANNAIQGKLNLALSLEVPAAFAERPPWILVESFFVSQHQTPQQ